MPALACEGLLYAASSLIELGRREEALEVLLNATTRFPSDAVVRYDLSCARCLLGRIDGPEAGWPRPWKSGAMRSRSERSTIWTWNPCGGVVN